MKKQKVKVLRCPEDGCGVVFATLKEFYEHLDDAEHCKFCGFAAAYTIKATTADLYCPACRLEDPTFPKDRSRVC